VNAGAYLLFWEKVGEKLWLGAVVEKGGGYKREVCKAIIAMGFFARPSPAHPAQENS